MDGTRLHGMHAVLAVHRRKAFNDETASLPCIQRAADGRSLPHAQASLVQFRVESVNGSSVLEKDGSVHGIAFRTGLVDRQYVPVVLPPDAVVKDQGAAVPGVKGDAGGKQGVDGIGSAAAPQCRNVVPVASENAVPPVGDNPEPPFIRNGSSLRQGRICGRSVIIVKGTIHQRQRAADKIVDGPPS